MADVRKYNDANRGEFAHDERNINNPVQYRKNYKIDKRRTHLNYDLISGKTGETAERGELEKRLEARLAQLTIRRRRENTVTFGSWVVTLPAELKGAEEGKQRDFFKHTLEFVQNRYGKDNIIGFWVHNDETTPHVHIKFVPEERKKTFDAEGKDITDYNRHEGTGVLLGKDIFKRGEYQTFHRDMKRHLEQRMGMRLSLLTGITKEEGNKTVEQLKRRSETLEQQQAIAHEQGELAERIRAGLNAVADATSDYAHAEAVFQAAADIQRAYRVHGEGEAVEEARTRLYGAIRAAVEPIFEADAPSYP